MVQELIRTAMKVLLLGLRSGLRNRLLGLVIRNEPRQTYAFTE